MEERGRGPSASSNINTMLFAFADPKSSGFLKRQVKVSGVGVIAFGGDRYFGSSVCQFQGLLGCCAGDLTHLPVRHFFPRERFGSRLRAKEVLLCRVPGLRPQLCWEPL